LRSFGVVCKGKIKNLVQLNYLKLIDTEAAGNRCDVTPLFADPNAFTALVDDITEAISLIKAQGVEIAGIATLSMDENEATLVLRKKYHCFSAQ